MKTKMNKRIVGMILALFMLISICVPGNYNYVLADNEVTDDPAQTMHAIMEFTKGDTYVKDGVHVWEADSPNKGHAFFFNIRLNLSGIGYDLAPDEVELPTELIEIKIPLHILKNTSGNYADKIELSVPALNELPYKDEGGKRTYLTDHSFAYVIEGDYCIIKSINDISTGEVYEIPFAYVMTNDTYDYEDLKPSEECKADVIFFTWSKNNSQEYGYNECESDASRVAIDTSVTLTNAAKTVVEKNGYSTLLSLSDLQSTESGLPAGLSDDYYYVLWDVTSTIGTATQRYDFNVDESSAGITLEGEDKNGNHHEVSGEVIGIKPSGKSAYVSGDQTTVSGLSASGKRTDRILVRFPKTVGTEVTDTTVNVGIDDLRKFAKPSEYKAINHVDCSIDPAYDPSPEKKEAEAVWKYEVNDPEYEGPVEQYSSTKYGIYNKGSKVTNENNISSYELEKLSQSTPEEISGLQYKADVYAYAYSKTTVFGLNQEIREMIIDEGDHFTEITCGEGSQKTVYKYDHTIPGNVTYFVNDAPKTHDKTLDLTELKRIAGQDLSDQYGHNDVIYSLEDKKLELIDPADDSSSLQLSADDYRIDSINYTINEYGVEYDHDDMKYNYTDVTYTDKDKLSFYVYTKGDTENAILAAVYHLSTDKAEIIDSTIVSGFGKDYISFKPDADVLGFKMETQNKNYYTAMTANPSVTLLPSTNVTDYVKNIVDVKKKSKAGLRNTAVWSIKPDGDAEGVKKHSTTIKGIDYIAQVIRKSKIDKKWLGNGDTYTGRDGNVYGTKNDVLNREYTVGWTTKIYETATGLDGTDTAKGVRQESGKIYDLLPAHSDIIEGSVAVYADGKALPSSSYTIHPRISNYNDSERKLLVIDINAPCDQEYVVKYVTVHSHEDLQDYSTMAINAIAYQTGNASIGNGYPDNGGKDNYTLHDYMIGLDPENGSANRFIYDEDKVDIMALMQSNSGIYKKVTTADNPSLSKSAVVHQGEEYSYNIRMKNSPTTKAYDIAVIDAIEDYQGGRNASDTERKCDWKGELVRFDLSGLEEKMELSNCKDELCLFLYVGDAKLNLQDDTQFSDATERKELLMQILRQPKSDTPDENGWINVENWRDLSSIDLSTVKAFIVYTGETYKLGKSESVSFTVTMKAPSTTPDSSASSEGYEVPPSTYNNVYRSFTNISLDKDGEEVDRVYFYSHYDYTDVSFKTTGRLSFSKVDTKDTNVKVEGAKFRVTGTSDYGTVVNTVIESDAQGHVVLEGLEKGVYTMVEEETDSDHRVDSTPRVVRVTPNGQIMVVTIENYDAASSESSDGKTTDIAGNEIDVKTGEFLDTDIKPYEIGNSPRIHGSVSFKKLNKFNDAGVYGASFRLTGTSDYGNEYDETVVSTGTGDVIFDDIEIGTYTMVEVSAADGYKPINNTFTVKVAEGPGRNPIITISGTTYSKNGEVAIYNTPYTKLDIYKIDAITEAGINDATFRLEPDDDETAQAVSDAVSVDPNTKWIADGTSYKQEYNSGNVGPAGEYLFENLVAGTYKLTEIPPQGYAAEYEEHTITVTENEDGYSIRFSPDADTTPKDESIEYAVYNSETKQFEPVTNKDDATCYRIRNEETFNNPKDVIKSWIGKPTETGFPAMHLSTEKPAGRTLEVTIGNSFRADVIALKKSSILGIKRESNLPNEMEVSDIPNGYMDDSFGDKGHFYAWVDDSDNILKWWSDAEVIHLPVDCTNLFEGCSAITGTLDLSTFVSDRTNNMKAMFSGCSSVEIININSFETESVTDMSSMFEGCTNLTTIVLDSSKFIANNNLTTVSKMFNDCVNLAGIDLRGFGACTSLTDISYWFCKCNKLKYIDLKNFSTGTETTGSIEHIDYVFWHTGDYDNKEGNEGSKIDTINDGTYVWTSSQWYCSSSVFTRNTAYNYFRIKLYVNEKIYKDANNDDDTKAKNHLKLSPAEGYGTAERATDGYFNDASTALYESWAEDTYGSSASTEGGSSSGSGNETPGSAPVTSNYVVPDKFVYEEGPSIVPDDNAKAEDIGTRSFIFDYETANEGTANPDGTYSVEETLYLTVKEIIDDNGTISASYTKYKYVPDEPLVAIWRNVDRDGTSQWICEMKVNQDTDFFAWEDKITGYASTALESKPLEVEKGTTPVITNSSDPVGGLLLSKTLVDNSGNEINGKVEQDSFWFKVVVTKGDDPYAVAPFDSEGVTYVKVEPGKNVVLGGIPVGCSYTVTEVTDTTDPDHPMPAGYVPYSGDTSPKTGTITANNNDSVKFKNEIIKHDIIISKTAKLYKEKQKDGSRTEVTSGPEYDDWTAEDFEFSVKLDNLCVETEYTYTINGTNYTFTSDDEGEAEIPADPDKLTLKNAESIIFKDLPYGAECLVVETTEQPEEENVKYETFVNADGSGDVDTKQWFGTLTDSDREISYTNNKVDMESEKISVVVEKRWIKKSGDGYDDITEDPEELPENIYVYVGRYAVDAEGNKITSPEFAVARSVVWAVGSHSVENWMHTFKDLDKSVEIDGTTYDYYYFVAESPVNGFEQVAKDDSCIHIIGDNEFIYEEDNSVPGVYKRTITNEKLQTGSLKIDKAVDGNFASRDKTFNFTVYLTDKDGNPVSGENFIVQKLDADGVGEEQAKFFDGSPLRITLSQGESYEFKNLPVGTRYIVTESDYSGEGYTTSVKMEGDADWQDNKRTINGSMTDDSEVSVHFKNTRQGIIPTGIYMNILIPILLLIISIAGIYISMIRSKRWKDCLEG